MRTARGVLLGVVLVAAGALASACSDESASPGPGACPDDVPRTCPASPPSYAKDVAPIVTASCATCHRPGGANPDRLLTSYDEIHAQRAAVLTQVAACRMPLPDAGALPAQERQTLLAWLVCGAKND
ncbi:MAG: hypothetical protein JWP97_6570 [Labilithrix sp.]|nr:hypothetical protein [Labilithrix sp.]